jgi:hypothetical protein
VLNNTLQEKIKEDHQKWEKNQRELKEIRAEDRQKWEDKKAEDRKKWEEYQKFNEEHKKTNDELNRKHNQLLGAVGRRWGLHSEASFRNALAGILKDFKDIEVINVTEWDENGVVFGQPDQVELDIIIKNGVLIVCEIKSSVSKSDMYIFERKVRFYEQKQTRQVSRMLIISPMVDPHAVPVADKFGIEIYSYADDVDFP